jgi:hypothetical protein
MDKVVSSTDGQVQDNPNLPDRCTLTSAPNLDQQITVMESSGSVYVGTSTEDKDTLDLIFFQNCALTNS